MPQIQVAYASTQGLLTYPVHSLATASGRRISKSDADPSLTHGHSSGSQCMVAKSSDFTNSVGYFNGRMSACGMRDSRRLSVRARRRSTSLLLQGPTAFAWAPPASFLAASNSMRTEELQRSRCESAKRFGQDKCLPNGQAFPPMWKRARTMSPPVMSRAPTSESKTSSSSWTASGSRQSMCVQACRSASFCRDVCLPR